MKWLTFFLSAVCHYILTLLEYDGCAAGSGEATTSVLSWLLQGAGDFLEGGQDVPPWRAAGTFWENFCNEGMVGEENPASRTCSTGETEKGRERTARQSSESDKKETCHAQTL